MIAIKDLTIANSPRKPLITDLSIELERGTLTALIGRNGCGKSTLLRVIAGLQKPTKGTVRLGELNPTKATAAELAKVVAVVTTEGINVRRLTCKEFVSFGRSPHTGLFGRLSKEDREIARHALEAVGMQEFAEREVMSLSDGETRRIMLARALAQDTPIILLDEPTSFLDVPGRYDVCELLAKLAREQQKTILYSTHELEPALEYADNIMLISNGKAITMPPKEMQQSEAFKDLTGGRILAL